MENKQLIYDQFIRNLQENNTVKKYCKSRQISHDLFKDNLFGYCPVYSRYSFPLLRGRLIVPIYDVNNKILAFAGRQIPENKSDVLTSFWETYGNEPAKCRDRINKWEKGKWINEPYQKTKNLFFLNFAKYKCLEKNYLILVEGYFDAYRLYENGLKNVAAICGTSISDYQVALALRYCDNIVIMMDSDEPGKIATKSISDKIEKLGGRSLKIHLPLGYDPDDFACKHDMSFLDEHIIRLLKTNKKDIFVRADYE